MSKEIKTRIKKITPDVARALLARNNLNRPIVRRNVEQLVLAIKTGRWKMNGDAIRISKNDCLMDGQHRLMAIIETGVACDSVVIEGLDDEVFTTIDQGSPRTVGQMLAIDGVKNYNQVASIISVLRPYIEDKPPIRNMASPATKEDLMEFFSNNQALSDSARFVAYYRIIRTWFSPSYLGFLHFIFNQKSPHEAEQFFDCLITGVPIPGKNQPLTLREKMIQIVSAPSSKKEDMFTRSAYCILAWNAFRTGREIKLFRWTRRGGTKQKYPRAI